MVDHAQENADTAIGSAIAALRGEMRQQQLADAMRERGWKWSQSTVWSVEKGDRPVRLAEAMDLAEILGVGLHELTLQPEDLEVVGDVSDQLEVLIDSMAKIEKQTRLALIAKSRLTRHISRARALGLDLPVIDQAEAWVGRQPETAVRVGRAQAENDLTIDKMRSTPHVELDHQTKPVPDLVGNDFDRLGIEEQLQRVLSIAGAAEWAEPDAEGFDLVVRLPQGRNFVVEVKRYDRVGVDIGRRFRKRIDQLADSTYWGLPRPAPEFVVLFVPREDWLNTALDQQPKLLEYAFERNVVIATPSTMVSLLNSVAKIWRGHALKEKDAAASAVSSVHRMVMSDPDGSEYLVEVDEPGPIEPPQLVSLRPQTYEATREIGEHFRRGNPVRIDLSEMKDVDAKRIIDFAAGLVFSLRGNIDRASAYDFILWPPGAGHENDQERASKAAETRSRRRGRGKLDERGGVSRPAGSSNE